MANLVARGSLGIRIVGRLFDGAQKPVSDSASGFMAMYASRSTTIMRPHRRDWSWRRDRAQTKLPHSFEPFLAAWDSSTSNLLFSSKVLLISLTNLRGLLPRTSYSRAVSRSVVPKIFSTYFSSNIHFGFASASSGPSLHWLLARSCCISRSLFVFCVFVPYLRIVVDLLSSPLDSDEFLHGR